MNRQSARVDLTKDMETSPHGTDILSQSTLVGELNADPLTPLEAPPSLVAFLLARHAHPISMHFPIAIPVVDALFSVLNLVFKIRIPDLAAVFNQIIATVVMPFSVTTGYFSWCYNYQRKESFEFRSKLQLSALLPFSMVGALWLFGYQYFFSDVHPTGPLNVPYHALVLATALNVVARCYLGKCITFPGPKL
jgi:uncharacterized membrane protein